MNAKEYLSQVRILDKKIDIKQAEIDKLRSSLQYKGIRYDTVQTSGGNPISMSSVVAKIVDYENSMYLEIDSLIDLRRDILNKLDKLTDESHLDLLYMRYIQYMKWEEIALKLNCTYRWVLKLHSRALKEFEKILAIH